MMRLFRNVQFAIPAIALILLCSAFAPGDDAQTSNPDVKVWAHLSRQTYKPGETGEITITLSPAEGYHINANPAVEIALDKSAAVILKGEPSQVIDRANGYLSSRSPVRQTFYVPSSTAAGSHLVKGTVTYFYCSDSEGWCRRYRQPVSFTFTLAQ